MGLSSYNENMTSDLQARNAKHKWTATRWIWREVEQAAQLGSHLPPPSSVDRIRGHFPQGCQSGTSLLSSESLQKKPSLSLQLFMRLQWTHKKNSQLQKNPVTADLGNLDSHFFYALRTYNPLGLAPSVVGGPSALHIFALLLVSGEFLVFLAGFGVHASHTDSWLPG